eukprot:7126918-Alexandrium_andersonii.AAC.1
MAAGCIQALGRAPATLSTARKVGVAKRQHQGRAFGRLGSCREAEGLHGPRHPPAALHLLKE